MQALESTSLLEQVYNWMLDHPSVAPETKREFNSRMYTAFGAVFPENCEVNSAEYKKIYDLRSRLRNCKKYAKAKIRKQRLKKQAEVINSIEQKVVSKAKPAKSQPPSKSTNEQVVINNDYPPLPVKDPGFAKFARWLSVPAYAGLFQWQEEHHELTWKAEYEMTLAPRDHGKSVEYTEKYQWAMQYQGFDVLLLGWTDRRKEIAQYVYNFFLHYGLVVRDKRTSPFHFQIVNGGRFDCYLITSKETLGMHSEGDQARFDNMTDEDWEEFKSMFTVDLDVEADRALVEEELENYIESRLTTDRKLWISIDDPIDISFMKERHKEDSLELHFNSSLYGIHPAKWSFTGTRKFEGDFFDFIEAKFGDELVRYVRKTMDENGKLLCPERFTHPNCSTYVQDLREGKRDLAKIRQHVGEYAWFSEYEQDPHPLLGEVWEAVDYVEFLDTPVNRKHDLCWITVDRATTTNVKTSDYTGCVAGVREIRTGNRITTHDFTGITSFDVLLIKINDFVAEFHAKHEGIAIIMVVEKQGGGDDFITMALNMKFFVRPDGTIAKNVIPDLVVIIPIHNTGNKLQRIKERLNVPLKNRKHKFLSSMRHSEVVREILEYPHPAKIDAIDALANVEFVILEQYSDIVLRDPVKQLARIYSEADYQHEEEANQKAMEERQLRNQLRTERQVRRSVF